jgi:hypothetical protein
VPRSPALTDPGRAVLLTSEAGAVTAEIDPAGRLTWHGQIEPR